MRHFLRRIVALASIEFKDQRHPSFQTRLTPLCSFKYPRRSASFAVVSTAKPIRPRVPAVLTKHKAENHRTDDASALLFVTSVHKMEISFGFTSANTSISFIDASNGKRQMDINGSYMVYVMCNPHRQPYNVTLN